MAPSFLDKVEIFCCNMYDMTRAHRSVITGVLGYVLLFNSGQYLGIVLLMQGVRVRLTFSQLFSSFCQRCQLVNMLNKPNFYWSFQVAGLSLFDKSLNELYDTYIRTRVAVQEAMPDASALIGLQEVILCNHLSFFWIGVPAVSTHKFSWVWKTHISEHRGQNKRYQSVKAV